ncbi:hypothetical protein GCM10023171_07930 [Microbacterium panaciterrae]|uniref:Uncharacterized protein n=1 Tax=Microbacterium panaciterrae TaxID=985759 RepID=A0ABP8P2I0_9MICO
MALLQLLGGLGADLMRRHLGGVEAVEQRPVCGLPGAERHHAATVRAAADIGSGSPGARVRDLPNLGIG